jgi:hypothetical protein
MVCQKVELITKYSFWAARHPFSFVTLIPVELSEESEKAWKGFLAPVKKQYQK